MTANTTSAMPDGIAAAKASQPEPLPPLTLPPSPGGAPPPLSMPPGAMPMPPAAAAPGGPAAPPMPVAAPQPPWKVRQQPDGSSIDYLPSPDGDPSKDVVIGVNPPPKLPKALQAPKPGSP